MTFQLLNTLALIVLCFALGLLFQRWLPNYCEVLRQRASQVSLLFIIPLAILNSLWQLGGVHLELLFVPMLGLGVIGCGAVTSILISKTYSLQARDFAALLPVMSFYNLGALGALFAFVLFGEDGVAIVALFKLFEEALYFGVIFPFCRSKGIVQEGSVPVFWKNPLFLVAILALFLGLSLGLFQVKRPEFLYQVSQVLIPIGSMLLVFAAGLTFHISGSGRWLRLSLVSAMLRVALGSVFLLAVFELFGMWDMAGGVLFPVCIMLACMPCGFIGVLPARLYGLNTAVANTSWIATYFVSLVLGGVFYIWL